MIILSNERFNFFKKCIVLCVYAEVNELEFTYLCNFERINKVIQLKNESTNETTFAEILVMKKHEVCFYDDKKVNIAIELRPTKKNPTINFYNDIKFYRYNNLTD